MDNPDPDGFHVKISEFGETMMVNEIIKHVG